jgi:hypothetical protein
MASLDSRLTLGGAGPPGAPTPAPAVGGYLFAALVFLPRLRRSRRSSHSMISSSTQCTVEARCVSVGLAPRGGRR